MNTHTTTTGAGISAAHVTSMTEEQRNIVESFDSRESVINRQVELVNTLKNRSASEPLPLISAQAIEEIKELAAINLYLNRQAL
jgi:hypothetical protein